MANLELRPVLWRKHCSVSDIIHRLQIYPSDSHNGRDGSTWTGEVTATLPAYLCNSYPFYWSRQSMAHTVTTVLHIPQTCSLLKSLCKYCLLSKWNQNPILWPNPPRYPLCIFPLKKNATEDSKKVPLQKHYKKACLKSQKYAHTDTDTRACTHMELGIKESHQIHI